ncbi:MAG: NUDIX hydrolase [Thermoanaerobaculia bacterium]|nr:NUDIX hydrolase [Thermoanaerobaculia bacterium]
MAPRVKELHAGRHLRLVARNGWEFVERPGIHGIVLVVAVTPGGGLLLVEQWREPVGAKVLELPAGLAGDSEGSADEPLEGAARRELLEETGWSAESMERLTSGPPSAGVTSEIVTLFRARGLSQAGPGGGVEGEAITVHEVPLAAVESFLLGREAEGTLVDPKVWAGLWFARRP